MDWLPTKNINNMYNSSQQWFLEARFGLFIHWGPYAIWGRGEQILFRERLDQKEYERIACQWNPDGFDARELVRLAKEAGARYCVFTARHHDGYCLWNSALTNYTSAAQKPGRDFVREYVEACREFGLKVGIYYSLADWRLPAYWLGSQKDPNGWKQFRDYVHGQVQELLTQYGEIDVIWFDGAWPHSAKEWDSECLVAKIRKWQSGILINNRLDSESQVGSLEQAGGSQVLGDFGTPEHRIVAEKEKPWESCHVTTWRLWGYARGEHYRSAAHLLDLLCDCSSKGGNLLLNVGLDQKGAIPDEAKKSLIQMGDWLRCYGDAIYGTTSGDLSEFVTYGYQTRKGNDLYLIYRFWPHSSVARVAGISTPCRAATLLSNNTNLTIRQTVDGLELHGLPVECPDLLFPVIRLSFDEPPRLYDWAQDRLWQGDPARMADWAESRGKTSWLDLKM